MANIRLVKVVKNSTFTTKEGKERHEIRRYVCIDNARILINLVHKDGYVLFDNFCEVDNQVRKDNDEK